MPTHQQIVDGFNRDRLGFLIQMPNDFPPLRREIFYVSPAVLQQLEMLKRADCEFTASPLVRDLVGVPVRLDVTLPRKVRTGGIVQRDPFATYEPADMDWAEPLGLASWEMTDLHIYSVTEPNFDYLTRITV